MDEKDKIIWRSYEYDYKEKTADWFWAIGIITICLAIISIIYDDALFAVFMAIAGFAVMVTARKKPREVYFEINTKGIIVDGTLYPYGKLKAFWIEESKFSASKLLIKSEKFITPIMVVPIETDVSDASSVRAFLLSFLPEEKMLQPFSHAFMNYLGF